MDSRILTEYLQGNCFNAYEALGAHPSHEYDQDGVRFTVYAPHARSVALIGECNGWQGYPMHALEGGMWTIFINGAHEGQLYKFHIETAGGEYYDRMDPFAFCSECRPNTASIVTRMDTYAWGDGAWMAQRDKNYNRPMSIYELHLGSWRRKDEADPTQDGFYRYDEIAALLIPYLKQTGYTHIELLPLTEYPFDGSWGYQTAGYFSATSRYGTPAQLMALIDHCHQAGIGVILDFVPLHFVTDFYALHQYDGGFLYESEDPSQRYSEWGTALFDFTKPHVQSFLKSALDFWIRYFHLDGVRYDAVSRLIYQQGDSAKGVNDPGLWFLKSANYTLQQRYPQVMLIAEDSSDFLKVTAPVVYGGLGFDYKWDLGWMNDTLEYLSAPATQRPALHHKLTFSMTYFYRDIFLLPLSHDEVVHGKKTVIDKLPGSYEEKFSQLRALYIYMFTHPGKKLNFMGNELAEFKEWDENKQPGWNLLDYPAHQAFFRFWQALQLLYQEHPALYQEDYHPNSFCWLNADDSAHCVYSYLRDDLHGEQLFIVLNFSNRVQTDINLPVGQAGQYEELLSTDDSRYGGSGRTDGYASARPQGKGYSIFVNLPPYSAAIWKRQPSAAQPTEQAAVRPTGKRAAPRKQELPASTAHRRVKTKRTAGGIKTEEKNR